MMTLFKNWEFTQPVITYSKLTIETLEICSKLTIKALERR